MYRIGIDIGGTFIRTAVFNEDFSIIKREQFPNDRKKSAVENIDIILEKVNFFLLENKPCTGIGIGCPGPLDFTAGKVLNPPNLPGWKNFDLVSYITQKTGLKTILNNDANCAGLAEAQLGAGKGINSVFYITVSTGIGGAFIYKGELVGGANSSAGEVYNLIVCDTNYSLPSAGNYLSGNNGANAGSLNEVCGGDALARQASAAYGRPVDAKELYDDLYLKKKENLAVNIVDRWLENLAKGIANISCVVDPDIFIVGGAIALKGDRFLETLMDKAKKYCIHPEALRMEKSFLGEDAGLIGAAMLIPKGQRD